MNKLMSELLSNSEARDEKGIEQALEGSLNYNTMDPWA